MVERIMPGARDQEIRELQVKIPELDKQIEHAKRMNEYDPWRYGTQQLRLQAERRACAERLIDLERSRPVDERSGWSPSSGAFWSGSNH